MSHPNDTPNLIEQIPPLLQVPIIGILRGYGTHAAISAARVVADRGIRVLEVTVDSEDAFETIESLADLDRLVVGVGTVTKPDQVLQAAAAGATFVVTPIFAPEVIEESLSHGLPIVCGAATPTEIHAALAAGATAAKVFPARQLGGPDYLRAILAPLSGARLVPTGGIEPSDSSEYLDAGAIALGAGGSLFPAHIARDMDWTALDDLARKWTESIP